MVTVTSPNISNSGLQAGAGGTTGGMTGTSGNDSRAAGASDTPEVLHNMAQGAHQTIDRLAEQVTPHVQRLQENMASATEMLDERADQLREMTDEWLDTLRSTVRENPLAAVGAALALGLLIARLSR